MKVVALCIPIYALTLVMLPSISGSLYEEDLRRQDYVEVPFGLDPGIISLDLRYNKIKRIQKNDFLALTRARTILLANNEIEFIDDESFSPCLDLNELGISNNKLIILPDSKALTRTIELRASRNVIAYIPMDFFLNMNSIRRLLLQRNELTTLPVFSRPWMPLMWEPMPSPHCLISVCCPRSALSKWTPIFSTVTGGSAGSSLSHSTSPLANRLSQLEVTRFQFSTPWNLCRVRIWGC